MTDNRTTELLNCPFCGGEAVLVPTLDTTVREWFVTCGNLECNVLACRTKTFYTEAEAIKAWNTRHERTCRPTIEPWECEPNKYDAYCGNCDYPMGDGELKPWNYCPDCGARVEGGA